MTDCYFVHSATLNDNEVEEGEAPIGNEVRSYTAELQFEFCTRCGSLLENGECTVCKNAPG
jgi:recombinational DNA repair protein RecR